MSLRNIHYQRYQKNLAASLAPCLNTSSCSPKISQIQEGCHTSFLASSTTKLSRNYHTTQRGFDLSYSRGHAALPSSLSSSVRRMSSAQTKPAPILPNLEMLKCKTTVEILTKASQLYSTNHLFGTRKGDSFEWITYADFGKLVDETRKVLAAHGVGVNDKVALICNNRLEWATFMYATQGVGGQIVPMYEAQLEKDWKYIIENSGAKLLVVANKKISDVVCDYIGKVGNVESVICLDAPEDSPLSYQRHLQSVVSQPAVPVSSVLSDDHIASVIYTSGTTGNPKGVELSHRNIVSDIQGSLSLELHGPLFSQHLVSLAFLPWAHVYGQVTELQGVITAGGSIAIVPSREQILECLQMAQPTLMYSVPMLFNKVHDGVLKNMAKQSIVTRILFKQALAIARERNHRLEFGESVSKWLDLKFKVADKVVLSKVRAKIGPNLMALCGGGAATSLPVLQFFQDIGIPILEGYGATETSPVVTASTIEWSGRRLGCVGIPLPEVDVKIVDPESLQDLPADTDGEIICSGPNVMVGYRNNPKATEEVFYYRNGIKYFRTGDLGRLVEGKFLKITGRIKEQFKLENGKFVVPAPLEDIYSRGPFIAQCFLYGVNRVNTIVLIVPNYLELKNYAQEHGIKEWLELLPDNPLDLNSIGKTPEAVERLEDLFKQEKFVQLITNEIIHRGKKAKHYERPFKWMPLVHPFTQESQHMTPKMSLRRANVVKDYAGLIEDMYSKHLGHQIQYKEK